MNVLFLHGFLGAPSMWDGVGVEGTRLVLPGHGEAKSIDERAEGERRVGARKPEGRPSGIDERAEGRPSGIDGDFTAAVDAIAAGMREPAIVVGYSMGARLALALTLRHAERVRGAVLVGVNPGIEIAAEREERARWDDAQADAILAKGLPAFVDTWERLPLFATQATLPDAIRAEERARRLSHTAQGAAWAMRALGLGRQPSLWDALGACRTPITFLAGERDTAFVDHGSRAARIAPHGLFRAVAGAGHNLALEAPSAVADAIRALLSSSSVSHERTHA